MLEIFAYSILVAQLTVVSCSPRCRQLYRDYGLSNNFNETVAHAIHSITINDLMMFKDKVSVMNGIPVVNPRLNDPETTKRVIPNAPTETIGDAFYGETMNIIDTILTDVGQPNDSLGPNWPPLARVIHKFHMKDLWKKLVPIYEEIYSEGELDKDICRCLKDVANNGIFKAVDRAAIHYTDGTTLTLLNLPLPKLTDAVSWKIWKSRLLHYYDTQALEDAAKYLVCALNY